MGRQQSVIPTETIDADGGGNKVTLKNAPFPRVAFSANYLAASVIHPLRMRFLHPMESSDPKEMAVLQKRKGKGLGLPGMG